MLGNSEVMMRAFLDNFGGHFEVILEVILGVISEVILGTPYFSKTMVWCTRNLF